MKKVISKTPVRISLASCGNDLAAYWEEGYAGFTVSLTINKFVFVTAEASSAWQFSKPDRLIKGAIKYLKVKKTLSIEVKTDLPAGTGLGTGGAIMVGLVNTLGKHLNKKFDKNDIANIAYIIEKEKLGFSCGKKDQYSTAFGGLNMIKYFPSGKVEVTPINLKNKLQLLMKHLLVFDTGIIRDSEKILKNQAVISRSKIQKGLHLVNHGAIELAYYLVRGDFEKVGLLMDEHWQIRSKIIPGTTNAIIDRAYNKAMKAGALGGRISGAGGGGYLIIYAPPSKRASISKAVGLKPLPFKFEKEGTKIL